MNHRIQRLLFRDNITGYALYVASVAVVTFVLINTLSGLAFHLDMKRNYTDAMEHLYIYKFDSSLYDVNHGCPCYISGAVDYSEVMQNRRELIQSAFDADSITSVLDHIYIKIYPKPEKANFTGLFIYQSPVFDNMVLKLTAGRLPYEGEKNVVILPDSFRYTYQLEQEYYVDYSGTDAKVKVIGYTEFPYRFDTDLSCVTYADEGIIFNPTFIDYGNARTLLVVSEKGIPDDAREAFMRSIGEDPGEFYKYDPQYEYSGEQCSLEADTVRLLRKLFISFATMFSVVFVDSYFGASRRKNYLDTLIRLGMSQWTAFLNVVLVRLKTTAVGMIGAILIYRINANSGAAGGISVKYLVWNSRATILAIAVILLVCALCHIPYFANMSEDEKFKVRREHGTDNCAQ